VALPRYFAHGWGANISAPPPTNTAEFEVKHRRKSEK